MTVALLIGSTLDGVLSTIGLGAQIGVVVFLGGLILWLTKALRIGALIGSIVRTFIVVLAVGVVVGLLGWVEFNPGLVGRATRRRVSTCRLWVACFRIDCGKCGLRASSPTPLRISQWHNSRSYLYLKRRTVI
ncbi:MAG: hypothetical protein ABEJ92_03300 [Halobacteriales archaeon]